MSYEIIQNTIRMVRGDSKTFKLELIDDYDYPYDLSQATGLFSIKSYVGDSTYLVQKPFYAHPDEDKSGGVIFFKLVSADTKPLEFRKYYFDIQITTCDGDPHTVYRGDFHLLSEIS
jgi:hypothetical protein